MPYAEIAPIHRSTLPALLLAPLAIVSSAAAVPEPPERSELAAQPFSGISVESLPPGGTDPEQAIPDFAGPGVTGDWWGWRDRALEAGIDLQVSLTLDWVGSFSGGLARGSATPWLLNLGLNLDLGRLVGWQGGEVFALGQIERGGDPSERLVGDLQGVDEIAVAGGLTQLSQLWFRQMLFEERLSVQVGKLDFESAFASPPASQGYLNSGMAAPSIFDDAAAPTYPDQAFGVVVQGRAFEWMTLSIGVFDGSNAPALGGPPSGTGPSGPGTFFDNDAGYFVIGEADLGWSIGALPGAVGLGGWGHTGRFERFDGTVVRGVQGGYAWLQQTLWLGDESDLSGPSLTVWLTGGASTGEVLSIPWSVAGGILWNGPIPGRPQDALGVGLAYAAANVGPGSPFTRRGELAIETFYRLQLTPAVFVQPDLQVIVDPGASSRGTAIVGILRLGVTF